MEDERLYDMPLIDFLRANPYHPLFFDSRYQYLPLGVNNHIAEGIEREGTLPLPVVNLLEGDRVELLLERGLQMESITVEVLGLTSDVDLELGKSLYREPKAVVKRLDDNEGEIFLLKGLIVIGSPILSENLDRYAREQSLGKGNVKNFRMIREVSGQEEIVDDWWLREPGYQRPKERSTNLVVIESLFPLAMELFRPQINAQKPLITHSIHDEYRRLELSVSPKKLAYRNDFTGRSITTEYCDTESKAKRPYETYTCKVSTEDASSGKITHVIEHIISTHPNLDRAVRIISSVPEFTGAIISNGDEGMAIWSGKIQRDLEVVTLNLEGDLVLTHLSSGEEQFVPAPDALLDETFDFLTELLRS